MSKKYTSWFSFISAISVLIFTITIASSTYFYIENSQLRTEKKLSEKELQQKKEELNIESKEMSLQDILSIRNGFSQIEEKRKNSLIHDYITALETLEKKYGIELQGFSYADKKITTTISIRNKRTLSALERMQDFISIFRENSYVKVWNIEIQLNRISSISGNEELRSIWAVFLIK